MSHAFVACVFVAALSLTGCRPPPADAPPVATATPEATTAAAEPPAKSSRKSRRAWE